MLQLVPECIFNSLFVVRVSNGSFKRVAGVVEISNVLASGLKTHPLQRVKNYLVTEWG